MDSMIPCIGRLTLHLTGAAVLSAPELERLTKLVRTFLAALDALP